MDSRLCKQSSSIAVVSGTARSVARSDAGTRKTRDLSPIFLWRQGCIEGRVTVTETVPERRSDGRRDRRKNSRSGRRSADPHDWRRVAWLFGLYAAYLSLRSVPAAIRRLFEQRK